MHAESSAKYLRISWHQFSEDTKKLAEKLKDTPWEGIIAITRGGLVPANILAYELNIKLIDTISISSYDDQNQRDTRILKKPSGNIGNGKNWLVVDDLVDTGKTGEMIKALYPEATLVTVYAKTHGKTFVDAFAVETGNSQWILLPWDEDPEQ